MNSIDKLAWPHIIDKKVLGARSIGKSVYYMPGGKRDHGESDHQALIREVREEVSVELLPETTRLAGIFEAHADGKPADTIVRMTCFFADFRGTIKAAAEIEALMWLGFDDKEKCSANGRQVLDWLNTQDLVE